MPYIIPNTTAIPQTVSAAQVIVNGTTCIWPADKIVEGVKVIHHIECSIGAENTGVVPAELRFTLQRDIGGGWESIAGEVACYTIASGEDARRKANFKVPYYTGISGFIPRYRLLAECPAGEITLHRAAGRDAVPTVTGKQEHEFEGDAPSLSLVVIKIGSPAGTGAAWTESNTNVQLVPLSGNRFAWHSRNSGTGRSKTDTVVGQYDENGNFSFGTLTVLDNFDTSSLSSNTDCVVPIGNGKFARHRTSLKSFDIYDCGLSGLVPSLVAIEQGSVSSLSYGCKNGLMCDGNHLALLPNNLGSFPNIYNALYIYSINNVSNTVGVEFETNNIWGETGRVLYYSAPASFAGCSANGGFLIAGRTAINGSSFEMSISFVNKTSGSVIKTTCSDLIGWPFAIHCQSNGVFAFAYIATSGAVRVRCGVFSGSSISFGGSFDYADGSILMSGEFHEGDMKSNDSGDFAFCFQDKISNTTQCIAFSTDGSTISCADTTGTVYTRGSVVLTLFDSGFAGKYILGNYGASGSADFPISSERYTSMIEVTSA